MNVLFLLIPLAFVLTMAGLLAFRWAVHRGEFDDLETPAIRVLLDEDEIARTDNESS